MNITECSTICKPASTKSINPINIDNGNTASQWWYRKILTTGDKASIMCINSRSITDELIQRYMQGEEWIIRKLISSKLTLYYNLYLRADGCLVGISI